MVGVGGGDVTCETISQLRESPKEGVWKFPRRGVRTSSSVLGLRQRAAKVYCVQPIPLGKMKAGMQRRRKKA